jgi:D-glycero-alpha-D-manno-heptose-7-phosphate kinase
VHDVAARAPVRVDFGGGWTDVPPYTTERGGCVCNLAIARYARATVRPRARGIRIEADGASCEGASARELSLEGDCALGAAAARRAGLDGVEVVQTSDFPRGAGLGGSSAAGVALAAAIAAWKNEPLERDALAERSHAVETEELGIAGGSQDHYAAAYGGALALHFGAATTVRRIPLSDALVAALEQQCIIAYTGEARISGATITAVLDGYRARLPRVVAALDRMRALAESMAAALAAERVDELGALVAEHWEHQRALHERISTPAIERVLAAARSGGALGGKALGASGGGCVVIVAPADRAAAVRARVASLSRLVPFTVDRQGAQVTSHEVEGAHA